MNPWSAQRTKLKAAFTTFCVAWADSSRGGTPLGGARPHHYTTSGTKRDGVVSDICADVGAEDQTRVLAVDADFVPRDLPPGSGKVLLLQRRVTFGKHRRDTWLLFSVAFLLKWNCRVSLRTLLAIVVKGWTLNFTVGRSNSTTSVVVQNHRGWGVGAIRNNRKLCGAVSFRSAGVEPRFTVRSNRTPGRGHFRNSSSVLKELKPSAVLHKHWCFYLVETHLPVNFQGFNISLSVPHIRLSGRSWNKHFSVSDMQALHLTFLNDAALLNVPHTSCMTEMSNTSKKPWAVWININVRISFRNGMKGLCEFK